jgi:hypothetical protein
MWIDIPMSWMWNNFLLWMRKRVGQASAH